VATIALKLASSNLAAPDWSLERTLAAVSEYGYDGLELRLLDGEPIEPLERLRRNAEHILLPDPDGPSRSR
jgi:sugar phosphate isomerase/epimerase